MPHAPGATRQDETSWNVTALETTQGQIDGFRSQLPFKCYLPEVASVGDLLKICPWVASRVGRRTIKMSMAQALGAISNGKASHIIYPSPTPTLPFLAHEL